MHQQTNVIYTSMPILFVCIMPYIHHCQFHTGIFKKRRKNNPSKLSEPRTKSLIHEKTNSNLSQKAQRAELYKINKAICETNKNGNQQPNYPSKPRTNQATLSVNNQ